MKNQLFTFTFTLHLLAAICATFGCSSPAPVYVATDRKIESCTNSVGIACKAVPDAVFAEMLVRLQRLKDLQQKAEVDARLSVPKN